MPAPRRTFTTPDQVLDMEHGKIELLKIDEGMVARIVLQPGWKWSEHEKPVVNGGDYCDVPHLVHVIDGQLHIVMSDGDEFDVRAGDVASLPAGHDGWVVGDDAVVLFDFIGTTHK